MNKQDEKAEEQEAYEVWWNEVSRKGDPMHVPNLARKAFSAAWKAALASSMGRDDAKDAWRPIETAPKDGTELLLVDDEGIRVVGRWSKHNHVPIYGWVRQVELYGEEVDAFDAVRWAPLPAAPAMSKEV